MVTNVEKYGRVAYLGGKCRIQSRKCSHLSNMSVSSETQQWPSRISSPKNKSWSHYLRRWKVRWRFVVHRTFLELHRKTALWFLLNSSSRRYKNNPKHKNGFIKLVWRDPSLQVPKLIWKYIFDTTLSSCSSKTIWSGCKSSATRWGYI